MTLVGLEYLKQQEAKRSNLAKEAEAHRSNVASETLSRTELQRKQSRDNWEQQLASRKQEQDANIAAGSSATWLGRTYQGVTPNSGYDIMSQVYDALRTLVQDVGGRTIFNSK